MSQVHILLVDEASPWDKANYQVSSVHRTREGAHNKGRKRTFETDGDSETASMMRVGYVVRSFTIED